MKNNIKWFCVSLCLVNFAYAAAPSVVSIMPSIQPTSCATSTTNNCTATIVPNAQLLAAPGTTVPFQIQVNQAAYPNFTFYPPIFARDDETQPTQHVYCDNVSVTGSGTSYTATVTVPTYSCILSAVVVGTYSLYSPPASIAADGNGNLWFTEPESNTSQIGVFSPGTGKVTQYPVAGGVATNLINDPSNNILWFNEKNNKALYSIDSNGNITAHPLPTLQAAPNLITLRSNGNVWFTEQIGGQFGNFDLLNNTTSEYTLKPAPLTPVQAIVVGPEPDNSLWFLYRSFTDMTVAKFNPGDQTLSTCILPMMSDGITAGLDGNLWLMESPNENSSRIGVMTPAISTTSCPISAQYPIYDPIAFMNNQIISAPEGSYYLWFTGLMGNQGGVILSTTTSGTIAAYQLPFSNGPLAGMTFDKNGNLWFVAQNKTHYYIGVL